MGRKKYELTVGRKKDVKNLTRTDDGHIINQHKVVFTEADKRQLESLVNSANRKRKRMKEHEANLFRTAKGIPKKQKIGQVQSMGQESDFILQPKSKSLQRFETREQFDNYIKNLQRVTRRDYIPMRVALYKENHLKAIKKMLGDDNDVYTKIKEMDLQTYMDTVASDIDFLEIGYVYLDIKRETKLEAMRSALKLKTG